jgi:hypothetical protein
MNFSIFSELNWIAIFLGALGYFILGAVWYSALFGKAWIRLTGVDASHPDAKKGMFPIMFFSFVMMFVTAAAIAIIRVRMDNVIGISGGIKLGAVTGFCFGVSAIAISYVYEKRPIGLYLINGFYILLGNIIAAVIICSWV